MSSDRRSKVENEKATINLLEKIVKKAKNVEDYKLTFVSVD